MFQYRYVYFQHVCVILNRLRINFNIPYSFFEILEMLFESGCFRFQYLKERREASLLLPVLLSGLSWQEWRMLQNGNRESLLARI